jgi:hypothetical protein
VQNHPGKTAAAVTGAVLIAAAAPAASHWAGDVGLGQAAVLNQAGAHGSLSASAGTSSPSSPASRARHQGARHRGEHHQGAGHQDAQHKQAHHQDANRREARVAGYDNPFRAIPGLIPERIDQGVDFGGSGPVYALGDAVITNATATDYGWPDGGWITYRLTKGPAAGLTVFLAEDVTPTVSAGQRVTSDTVIAKMYNGAAGIETGWATSDSSTAESQLSEAGGISGYGPFPTEIGMNFEELLQALGVPAGNNRHESPSGLLPSGYPADWPTALKSYRP